MLKHRHGGDIYTTSYRMDYSANINPCGMPDSVAEAARASVLNCVHYPDVDCSVLRKALAEKEGVDPKWLIFGNGAAELIFSIVHAGRPKKALLIAPGFAEYEQALKSCGCDIQYFYLNRKNGFCYEESYKEQLKDQLDMIFLCNPNNPTGLLIEKKEVLSILKICREKQIQVVLDSCFLDFLEEKEEADFSEYLMEYPNLFILKAFTKIYAMAGLRLGYGMCADVMLLDKMRKAVQPWSVSVPAQAAGLAALKEDQFVEESRKLIGTERRWLKEKLEKLGLWVCDSRANYLFFEAPENFAQCCAEQGILIRDCSNYEGLRKGYFRIAVRTRKENEELIRVFQEILNTAERQE